MSRNISLQIGERLKSITSKKISIRQMSMIFLPLIFVIFLLCVAKNKNPDNDMWWMMATGRYIVENKEIPQINPFIIHEDFAIIIQQWFMSIINYSIYDAFGIWGLIVLALTGVGVNAFLLWKYVSCFTCRKDEKRILVVIGILLCSFYLSTRPTQFTIAVLLIEQIAIIHYKKEKKKAWLWLLPLLSIIEINLHASFWPVLFLMLLPHIVPDFLVSKDAIRSQMKEKKDYVIPSVAAVAMGMFNPNGIDGMLYLLNSYNDNKMFSTISEVKSPQIWTTLGGWIVLAIVVMFSYLKKIKDNEFDISKAYLGAGVAILAARHIRNIWFLLFLFLSIGPSFLKEMKIVFAKLKREHNPKYDSIKRVLTSSAYVLLVLAMLFVFCYIENGNEKYIPSKAADYLDEMNKDNILLYTSFNSGGYMEWRGYEVYIDARPELFTKKINGKADVADEYYEVHSGSADYKAFLEKYNFTHLLTEANSYLDLYLECNQEYNLVVSDENYVLYEKQQK